MARVVVVRDENRTAAPNPRPWWWKYLPYPARLDPRRWQQQQQLPVQNPLQPLPRNPPVWSPLRLSHPPARYPLPTNPTLLFPPADQNSPTPSPPATPFHTPPSTPLTSSPPTTPPDSPPPPPPPVGRCRKIWNDWGRIFLTFLACASWAFSWLSLCFHRKHACSLCLYFQDEINVSVKSVVLAVAVIVCRLCFIQWKPREVGAHRCPVWVKCAIVQPFFTLTLLFLGEHSTDKYSAFIGASWCVFAVCVCLLTGVVDDFSFMETCMGVSIQAIFVLHNKEFPAYAIIFFFTSGTLVIKQVIAQFYVQPALPPPAAAAAADILATHDQPEHTTVDIQV